MVPAHTTPLPNIYLDEFLPHLSASELKLLLVITRQTLGWLQKDGSRKPQDWMTGKQLQRRTGNSHTSVSAAIESLVCKGLIEVRDEMGTILSTPAQRRRCSKLYFSLKLSENFKPPMPRTSVHTPFQNAETTKEQSLNNIHSSFVVAKKRKGQNSSDVIGSNKPPGENESSSSPQTPNSTTASISTITSNSIPSGLTTSSITSDELDLAALSATLSQGAKDVLQAYRMHFKQAFPCLTPPLASRSDLESLESYLKQHNPQRLISLLPRFFQLDYGFNARRKYSLHSFLHSVNILLFGSSKVTANHNETGKRGLR